MKRSQLAEVTKGPGINDIAKPGTARRNFLHRAGMHTNKIDLPGKAGTGKMLQLGEVIQLVADAASHKPDCLVLFCGVVLFWHLYLL